MLICIRSLSQELLLFLDPLKKKIEFANGLLKRSVLRSASLEMYEFTLHSL